MRILRGEQEVDENHIMYSNSASSVSSSETGSDVEAASGELPGKRPDQHGAQQQHQALGSRLSLNMPGAGPDGAAIGLGRQGMAGQVRNQHTMIIFSIYAGDNVCTRNSR